MKAAPRREFNLKGLVVIMRRGLKWGRSTSKSNLCRVGGMLAAMFVTAALAAAADFGRDTFVLTSTNSSTNDVLVFKLDTDGAPSLSLVSTLPTGGAGGASANAGAVQFNDGFGVVVNYGSNNVSQLVRGFGSISVAGTINLAPNCVKPVSAALTDEHLFVVGANCAESHSWPSGNVDGAVVALADTTAGQIAVGETWGAVTLESGSVLQLSLTNGGALNGASTTVTLPAGANKTPLGAAFWKDLLGFNPAHSPDSFALVDKNGDVFPVAGPTPPYPGNAPCWLAKGPGNIWYSGNSPAHAISIFFGDGQGGVFYKSVALPGVATDITVSPDRKWLAVIYSASDGSGGRVAVFSIDGFGDLTPVATSNPVGVAAFNGVAFSQ